MAKNVQTRRAYQSGHQKHGSRVGTGNSNGFIKDGRTFFCALSINWGESPPTRLRCRDVVIITHTYLVQTGKKYRIRQNKEPWGVGVGEGRRSGARSPSEISRDPDVARSHERV